MQLSSRTIQRHFSLAALVILALAAFLDARALGAMVSLELTPSVSDLARGGEHLAPPASFDASPERTTSADAILRRNPFDSVTGSLLDTGEIHGDSNAAPLDMAACAGLRAEIIVTSHEPAWSFAVIAMANEPKALLRRSGGAVGDKEVVYVARDRVWLRTRAGTLCQARIFAPKEKSLAPLDVNGLVRVEKLLDPTLAKGIVLVGPREYAIDRGVIDRIFEQYAELLKGTVVTPDKENGRTVGVRLMGIRAGTVLAALGIENGDRVVTVNGFDVTDPEKALTAFGIVRSAPRVVVELSRAGQSTRVQYDVR
jgi:general secretion pathway protein C